MFVELEFRDPYTSLLESFSGPDEPFREMGRFSFVQIYHGHVRAQSEDNSRVFDSLAKVIQVEDDFEEVGQAICFETPDGKRWAEMVVTPGEDEPRDELLDLARAYLADADRWKFDGPGVQKARTAIAKAEGRTAGTPPCRAAG